MAKTKQDLLSEHQALMLALEDVLDIIQQPGRYHHRLVYDPAAAPRGELKPPGAKGGQAIIDQAKAVLARAKQK